MWNSCSIFTIQNFIAQTVKLFSFYFICVYFNECKYLLAMVKIYIWIEPFFNMVEPWSHSLAPCCLFLPSHPPSSTQTHSIPRLAQLTRKYPTSPRFTSNWIRSPLFFFSFYHAIFPSTSLTQSQCCAVLYSFFIAISLSHSIVPVCTGNGNLWFMNLCPSVLAESWAVCWQLVQTRTLKRKLSCWIGVFPLCFFSLATLPSYNAKSIV